MTADERPPPPSGPLAGLETPFLDHEPPAGQRAEPWQAQLGELETETAFAGAFDLPWAQPGPSEMERAEESGEELVSPGAFELEEAGIIGSDNRLRVKDTTGVPWRWICKIDIADSRGRPAGAGTGLLISNRHVLTAAHVVHDAYKNMQQYTITVIPALDDLDEPFGRYALASKPKIRQEYDPTAADSLDWDYALLTLGSAVGDQRFKALNDRPLCFWGSPQCGKSTMLARLEPGGLNGKAAHTAGYPGGKGGRQLWCAAGLLHSANQQRRTMYTTADTTRGQSGSPVWVIDNKRHCLVGIAAGAGTGSNRIVRVTRELVHQLRAWITEGGETPAMVETEEALEPPVLLLPQPKAPPLDEQPVEQQFDPTAASRLVDGTVEPEHELSPASAEDTAAGQIAGSSYEEPGLVDPELEELESKESELGLEPVAEVEFEEDIDAGSVIYEDEENEDLTPLSFLKHCDDRELDPSPYQGELTDFMELQAPAAGPRCYTFTQPTVVPSIGFEFDLGYGASKVRPPLDPTARSDAWEASVYDLEGKNITKHRIAADGFRVEGDGNRLEIATNHFPLTDAGRADMRRVMRSVLGFVDDMARRCALTRPDRTLGFPSSAGAPRHFVMPSLETRAACVFPLALDPRKAYYRDGCTVAASPQATFTLPLARIDDLVTSIRRSERHRVAGLALSGPSGDRLGDRSVALYDAQRAVTADRSRHLRAGTVVSGVGPVTAAAYSKNLQGLVILMVSYLRAGELTYGPKDWEIFAKAYLPLNVKNPFRLLFADLSDTEKRTFKALYDAPAPAGRTALWQLARPGATSTAGATSLFPANVQEHQRGWFDPPPTWDDLVAKTVNNQPLIRTQSGPEKKGEDVGCEVLFAPLSRAFPYEPGSLRVMVELRRIGFNWVFAHANGDRPGWSTMTARLFDLARELNA